MIKFIFTAVGLGSLYEVHSKELSAMPLRYETRFGEIRRDFL